jgi:integrase
VTGDAWHLLRDVADQARRLALGPSIRAILDGLARSGAYVFMNSRTQTRYTVNGARHISRRAITRAAIQPAEDVTLHTLRHTALTRMITAGCDTFTVMAVSGHSSVRMLERYTYPGVAQRLAALETGAAVGTIWAQLGDRTPVRTKRGLEEPRFAEQFVGGRHRARTCDLRVANAALSQLS